MLFKHAVKVVCVLEARNLGDLIDLKVRVEQQGTADVELDITQYLVKGKNVLQYQMSMAADAGTSSKATVVLSLSKLTARQGNAIELTGQYARQYIRAADGPRLYQVEVFVP